MFRLSLIARRSLQQRSPSVFGRIRPLHTTNSVLAASKKPAKAKLSQRSEKESSALLNASRNHSAKIPDSKGENVSSTNAVGLSRKQTTDPQSNPQPTIVLEEKIADGRPSVLEKPRRLRKKKPIIATPEIKQPRARRKKKRDSSEGVAIPKAPSLQRTKRRIEDHISEGSDISKTTSTKRSTRKKKHDSSEGLGISNAAPAKSKLRAAKKKKKAAIEQSIKFDGDPRLNIASYLEWALPPPHFKNSAKQVLRGDTKRMNIVSGALCDDILERLSPSLQKHIGCDIVDINPGAGLWSQKLHDFIKPRSHILLEPEVDIYKPFLQPLVDTPDSRYKWIPKSGLVWEHLETVLSEEHLPFQTKLESGDPRLEEPNNTLLLIANLAYHPKKPYRQFGSIASLVLYQLLSSVRSHSHLQQYGLVRMLIWFDDAERRLVLPKDVYRRRKSAIEAEISCETIDEVASSTLHGGTMRPITVELERIHKIVKKMQEKGLKIPEGRESSLLKVFANLTEQSKGDSSSFSFSELDHLMTVKEEDDADEKDMLALSVLPSKSGSSHLKAPRVSQAQIKHTKMREEHITDFAKLLTAQQNLLNAIEPSEELKEEVSKLTREYNQKLLQLSSKDLETLRFRLDTRLVSYSNPPTLLWDRREVEPLKVHKAEFFPRHEMCLLDFHPRSIWPVLRENFPDNYDVLDYMLSSFFTAPSQSLRRAFSSLAPGAYEWLIAECPSLMDPSKGGGPNPDLMSVRRLTAPMLEELVKAWLRWPFKPTRNELLAKLGGEIFDPEAMGIGGDSASDFQKNN